MGSTPERAVHATADPRTSQLGVALGILAIVFWSFGASFVYLGARETGTWPFVAVGSFVAAVIQFLLRRILHGDVRSAICLPWWLWAGPVLCFVIYGLAWPLALASSSENRVFGVSLINYLWPVLTVVFSVFLVPGVRLTPRTLLALSLAVAGLALANARELPRLFYSGNGQSGSFVHDGIPYLLALLAAVTWAIYSALLSRWRNTAKEYVTSPVGFFLIGISALLILHSVPNFTGRGLTWTLLYGVGPLAAGYLLWELALARARVQTLSIIAGGTPVLSTFLLCLFLRRMPGPELFVAAALVSTGVVLSRSD